MKRPPRMRLLVAAVTALTLATPSVAMATPDPPPWMGVTCAGGVLTVVTTPARTITATGWILPCAPEPWEPDYRFTLMYYGVSSVRQGQLLEYTAGATGQTHFARSLETAELDYPVMAVCLVAHPGSGGRLACAAAGPPEGSGLPPAVPISVDDPIVRRLPVPGASPVMDTFCGTCV